MTSFQDKVVVITGASSGIGRAAARLFSERGARVVLAARGSEELEKAAAECAALGTIALAVPTDVSDPGSVDALAAVALSEYGAIDIWVNDAGVYMMGEFSDVPLAVHRRLVEVNVMGVIHGMRAALRHFEQRGHGIVINVASAAGRAPYALASTYCGSKAAVRAITEAVRQEQRRRPGIEVCLVSPASVDTPLFVHAANYTGLELKPMPPIYDVARVAHAIVRVASRPRRELSVGATPGVLALMRLLMKPIYERLQPKIVRRTHLGTRPASDQSGNLFQPSSPGGESGGWKRSRPYAILAAIAAGGIVTALRRRHLLHA